MKARSARWLVRLYPRKWRDRHGEAFAALLQGRFGGLRALADVLSSALHDLELAAAVRAVLHVHLEQALEKLGPAQAHRTVVRTVRGGKSASPLTTRV